MDHVKIARQMTTDPTELGPNSTPADAGGEELTLTEQELFERLGWFTNIRWFMAAGTLGLLFFSWYALGVRFLPPCREASLVPPLYVTGLIFTYNAMFAFLVRRMRTHRRITSQGIVALALGQIACDMLAVTGLVHHTGGVENYFVILVLLPMGIASELLPQKLAYATAAGASLLINFLAWGEYRGVLEHVHVDLSGSSSAKGLEGLYTNWVYVLQVSTALSVMSFAMVFIASAISKRLRRREAELEDAYRRLEQADDAKSFFMRKAGHEMRAPLAAICSMLDAIGQDAGAALSPEQQRLMARAAKRSQALMELVNDLRRYSRLRTAPADMLHRRSVFLDELAAHLVDLFHKQAAEAALTLEARLEPTPIAADEELLKQVITNLIANAIQYTPKGGRIDVSVRMAKPWAELTVSDTGMGITPEARNRLFEEFYRSPEAKKAFPDGTGLGLSICKRIVDIHGGQLDVAAGPEGRGTTFTVRLPLAETCPVDGSH
jgi:signal transduction histidine kinase